jgi:hypothetical protein
MVSRRLFAPFVVAAAVAGGGLAGAALGIPAISGAQESEDAPADSARPARPHLLEAAAEALGMEVSELRAALVDGKTIAEVAQERGVDVNAVIDAMVASVEDRQRSTEEIRARITELVNEGRPEGGFPGHRGRHHFGGAQLDAAAEALGIETDDLAEQLRDGKTIADIAEEQGVDVDTVIDAMVAQARERITTFVNEGVNRPEGAADEGTD